MCKKMLLMGLMLFVAGNVCLGSVCAKEYPTKPIELVCMFTPGGSMDLWSRMVAEIAQKQLGQPVVVLNKPGATGSIAAADVISSKADGYKMLFLSNFFKATTVKTQKVPFDHNDLVPIGAMLEYRHGLCVRGDSPFKNLQDVLDYAKKNPGKLKWSHHGRGSTIHIIPLSIFKKAGVQTIDVPYKGGSEQLMALLGGHVDLSSNVYAIPKEHVKAGKVRFLVWYNAQRFSETPGVPTVIELGFPEIEKLATVVIMYVHKNTPPNIKKILVDTFKKIYDDPEYRKAVEKIGEMARYGTPEQCEVLVKQAEEAGVPIIKELGLYLEK